MPLQPLKDFSYKIEIPTDPKRKKELEDKTLKDWNRYISQPMLTDFTINGETLSQLANNRTFQKEYLEEKETGKPKVFKDLVHLKKFFKDYLFKKIKDETKQNEAVENACYNLSESYVLNSASWHIWAQGLQNTPKIDMKPSKSSTEFESTPEGVRITETHHFTEWRDQQGKAHIKSKTDRNKDYATTQSAYLFTADDVQLIGEHHIVCESKNLSALFTGEQKPGRLMRNIFKMFQGSESERPETPRSDSEDDLTPKK